MDGLVDGGYWEVCLGNRKETGWTDAGERLVGTVALVVGLSPSQQQQAFILSQS